MKVFLRKVAGISGGLIVVTLFLHVIGVVLPSSEKVRLVDFCME